MAAASTAAGDENAFPVAATSGERIRFAAALTERDEPTAVATVVVVDDQPLFVEGVRAALSRYGIEVVAAAAELEAVVSIAGELSPDVVLVNLRLARNELGWVTRLAEASPHELIVVADDTRPELIDRALALGAACVVGESIQPDDLARAILLVSNQAPVAIGRNPRPAAEVATGFAHAAERLGAEALTKREQEILELVADGRTNVEVAQMLWVTEQTVKFHLANVYRKLGVTNRTEASRRAHDNGLLPSSAR
jgi:DNA-binding NarL/FixJ family response regulator